MKYIGIGLIWLGYAGMVIALAFAPKISSNAVVTIAIVGGILVSLISECIITGKESW